MKNILLLFVTVFIFFGCMSDADKKADEENVKIFNSLRVGDYYNCPNDPRQRNTVEQWVNNGKRYRKIAFYKYNMFNVSYVTVCNDTIVSIYGAQQ